MHNARGLMLAGIASFVAVTISAPTEKEIEWSHNHWVQTLDSCNKVDHVEQA